MGAARIRIQTADKNISIIHTTAVHQSTSCEEKNCMFVRINPGTLNHCFCPSPSFPPVKKVHLLLSLTFTDIFVSACKRCLICAYFSPDSDETTFSLEKVLLLYKTQIDANNSLILNYFFMISYKHVAFLIIRQLLDWSGVDYCDVFISCLDSHSDGTHSLQRIHWWASNVIIYFSKSDEETKSSTSQMAWGE